MVLSTAADVSAQYRIDTWTTEQGLPQSSVTEILQTRDGFLWIATYGGLARFDGITFRIFDSVTAPGMASSRIVDIIEDGDGVLWARTEGHALVRYAGDTFRTVGAADGLPDGRADRLIRTRAGGFFVISSGRIVEWTNGRFVPFAASYPMRRAGLEVLGWTDAGVVWYADEAGVHRFEIGRPVQDVSLPIAASRVWEDRTGRLWLRSGGDLFSYAGGRLVAHDDPLTTQVDFFTSRDDRDGTVWWGGVKGLVRFRDGRFTQLTKADGLPSNVVGIVYQDREGTHWVPTDGGLARLTARPITTYTTQDGLEADNTYPILQDRRGDIWIGGWQGLTRYTAAGRFEPMSVSMGLSGARLLALMEDRDGGLWVGRVGGGLRRYKDGEMTEFPGSADVPDTTRIIYEGRAGDIWFGAPRGVFRYHDGRFSRLATAERDGVREVTALHEDRTGALWIGHAAGVTRHAGGSFTTFTDRDGFPGRAVRAIHEDRDGVIWLGTYDSGLFRYRDGHFTRYTTLEGLPSNGAFRILEDTARRFWICSNVGLYRVAKEDLDAIADKRRVRATAPLYGRRDGMANQECNGGAHPAGIQARDGRMWFPTQQGVAVFDPATVPVRTAPPPVVITELFVGNNRSSPGETVRIAAGVRTVEMHYAALTFFEPELSRFKYRMDGLDADWVEAGDRRVARYGQLPYGDFRFRVIAANRDGVWNEEGASVAIVVVRPFWRTRWFFALVVFAAVGIGVGVHRWRMGLVRQQQVLGETFSRQLIETQEEERRRVAAGLHDSLSQTLMLMKNWAVIGQSSLPADHAARVPLADISAAASRALGEVREISYNLGPYQLERLGLARTIQDMVDKVESASGIRFMPHLAPVNGTLRQDQQIAAFRVIQEALNNIIKHSAATEVSLVLEVTDRGVRVAIHDNGRGFDATAASSAASRRHGFGLLGMSERVRLAGGRLRVESSEQGGTLVEFELPRAGDAS